MTENSEKYPSILDEMIAINKARKGIRFEFCDYIADRLVAVNPSVERRYKDKNGEVITDLKYDQPPLLTYFVPRDVIKRVLLKCPSVWPRNLGQSGVTVNNTPQVMYEIREMQNCMSYGQFDVSLVSKILFCAREYIARHKI